MEEYAPYNSSPTNSDTDSKPVTSAVVLIHAVIGFCLAGHFPFLAVLIANSFANKEPVLREILDYFPYGYLTIYAMIFGWFFWLSAITLIVLLAILSAEPIRWSIYKAWGVNLAYGLIGIALIFLLG